MRATNIIVCGLLWAAGCDADPVDTSCRDAAEDMRLMIQQRAGQEALYPCLPENEDQALACALRDAFFLVRGCATGDIACEDPSFAQDTDARIEASLQQLVDCLDPPQN